MAPKNIIYVKDPFILKPDGNIVFVFSHDMYNDDWMKYVGNSKAEELKIHEDLAKLYEKEQKDDKK